MVTFVEAQEYLDSFVNYEEKIKYSYEHGFRLARVESFLKSLGDPQKHLRAINVAGTKGKGSTCAFLANILSQAGFKVGLYTSPHLATIRERIRIFKGEEGGCFSGLISEEDLCKYVERLKSFIDDFNLISSQGELTFFEICTALAFLYFKENSVDFTILETGMGGRLDATNTTDPLVSVVTPISLEHAQLLGSSIAEISREKAGIIKNIDQMVVVAPQVKEALNVIRSRCKEIKAKSILVGEDILFEKISGNVEEQVFNCSCGQKQYSKLQLRLIGKHQLVNAACSIGAIEALKSFDINIAEEAVRSGLQNTCWPGRFEIVSKKPIIVLDGAQNAASAVALSNTLEELFVGRNFIFVLGVSSDKDIKGISEIISPIAKKVILTQAQSCRAMSVDIMEEYFKPDIVQKTKNISDALDIANTMMDDNSVIVITGSLFVVAQAREKCLS